MKYSHYNNYPNDVHIWYLQNEMSAVHQICLLVEISLKAFYFLRSIPSYDVTILQIFAQLFI